MKKLLVLLFISIFAFTLSACDSDGDDLYDSGKKQDEQVEDPIVDDTMKLTLTELAMYDGQDGNDAYVAVNGIIYDVTGINAWTGGSHNGNMAGQDLTDVIMNAPHGEDVLEDLTIIGELIE